MVFYPCVKCHKHIRPRQHAISCDSCGRWQHRTCQTGVSLEDYKNAVRTGDSLAFVCRPCTERIPARHDDEEEVEVADRSSQTEMSDDQQEESRAEMPEVTFNLEFSTGSTPNTTGRSSMGPLTEVTFNLDYSAGSDRPIAGSTPSTTRGSSIAPLLRPEVTFNLNYSLENGTHSTHEDMLNASMYTSQESRFYGTADTDTVTNDETSGVDIQANSFRSNSARDTPSESMDLEFDISNRVIDVIQEVINESLAERSISDSVLDEEDNVYEVVELGTKRGAKKLICTAGYSYTIKRINGTKTTWTCIIRNKNLTCRATVMQNGNTFIEHGEHAHVPDPGIANKVKITAKVKQVAGQDVSPSSSNC